MSMFNAFGQNGFAALAQTLENIGNIVAPIAPEEDDDNSGPPAGYGDESDENEETFDDRVQGFFSNFRDSIVGDRQSNLEPEPSSPGSFVSVELGDESPLSVETKGSRSRRSSKLAATISSSFGVVNGVELEKKVQQKYREQLEEEISNSERKYADLQHSTTTQISLLEKEVKDWRKLAESTPSNYQGGDDSEREEEMNVLYDKLGALTRDLEQRDDELSAARDVIAQLQGQVRSNSQEEESARVIEELEAFLEAQKAENTALLEQLEEARDLQSQAEEREQALRTEREDSEEKLNALTNELRASNKTIAALEQRLADAHRPEAEAEDHCDAGAAAALAEAQAALEDSRSEAVSLHGRVAEFAERLTERDEMLLSAEQRHSELLSEVSNLSAQLQEAQAACAVMQASMQNAVEQQQGTEGSLRELQALHASQGLELQGVLAQVAELRRVRGELDAQCAKDAQKHAQCVEQLRVQVAAYETECAALRTVAQRAEASVASLTRDLQDASLAQNAAEQSAQALTVELAATKKQLAIAQSSLSAAVDASAVSPAAAAAAAFSLDSIAAAAAAAVTPAAETDSTSNAEEALAALQAEHNKAIKKIKMLSKQLKDKDADVAKLTNELAAHSSRLQELEVASAASAASESTGDAGNITVLREQLVTCDAELETLRASHAEVFAQFQALSQQRVVAEVLQKELDSVLAQHRSMETELAEIREQLRRANESVEAGTREVSELHSALERERAAHSTAVSARDALQEQVSHMLSETRRALRSDSVDSCLSETADSKMIAGSASVVDGNVEDGALTTARADYSKAIKKIKLVNRQLKDKDVELLAQRARAEACDAELAAVRGSMQELQEALQASRSESAEQAKSENSAVNALRQEVNELRASVAAVEGERDQLMREAAELQVSVQEAHAQAACDAAQLEALRRSVDQRSAEAQQAQERIMYLEQALTESETTLKATEETAWQCKAEASELLCALEHEQGKASAAGRARDDFEDRLARCQGELKQLQAEAASASANSSNHIADVAGAKETLSALHGHLTRASDALRFAESSSLPYSTTLGSPAKKSCDGTFEHLLENAAADLVGPLSLLTLMGKTVAALAEQIMAHLRETSELSGALQAEHGETQQLLHAVYKCLSLQQPGVLVDNAGANATLITSAKAVLQQAERLSTDVQTLQSGAESATSEVSRLSAAVAASECSLAAAQAQWTTERAGLLAQLEQAVARVASLQSEVQHMHGLLDSAAQKSQDEKHQLANALAAAQATAAQGVDQLQPLRAQVQKLDTENKQLHQVIAQLRQVRKASKGESDNALAERDELKTQCAALQAEVAALQESLRVFTANDVVVAQLRSEVGVLAAGLSTAERSLEIARRSLAQREKDCYDKDAELEVTRSDMLIARQELERRVVEVMNLQEAVSQVESEKTFAISRFQRDLAEKLDACKRAGEAEKAQIVAQLQAQLDEERERRSKLEGSTQDYELFYRKAEMDFAAEKRKMQRTLENALQQLNNSETQVIDRMLVANLIVSYFKRRRSTDVLKIIAKVLAFDDEQLIAVGLKVPPIDLLGTLLTTVMGRPAPAPEVEGNNLAEQWINFLINESDQDAANSAGLVGRARSGSSGANGGSPRNSVPVLAGKTGGL